MTVIPLSRAHITTAFVKLRSTHTLLLARTHESAQVLELTLQLLTVHSIEQRSPRHMGWEYQAGQPDGTAAYLSCSAGTPNSAHSRGHTHKHHCRTLGTCRSRHCSYMSQLLTVHDQVCGCKKAEQDLHTEPARCSGPKAHRVSRSLPAILIGRKTAVLDEDGPVPEWPMLGPSTSQLVAIHQCDAATIECHALGQVGTSRNITPPISATLRCMIAHSILCCPFQPFYAFDSTHPDRRVRLLRPLLLELRQRSAGLVMRLEGAQPSTTARFPPLVAHYVLVPLCTDKCLGLLREVACRESITSVRIEPLLLPGLGTAEPRLGRPLRDERAPGPLDEAVQDDLLGVVPTLEGGTDHRMAVYGGHMRRLDEIINRYEPSTSTAVYCNLSLSLTDVGCGCGVHRQDYTRSRDATCGEQQQQHAM